MKNKHNRGFALLISVIFMSVMLALGLSISSLGYKQQLLASAAIESQQAFYAADAGIECALYEDYVSDRFKSGGGMELFCGGSQFGIASSTDASNVIYKSRLSLGDGARCADITIYKNVSGTTYMFSQGYDVPCGTVETPGGARFVSRGISSVY
ncbi:MAG: pilus assembly PilX N-terminal domain-containing protein [Candidatus Paceibacterota bacterium]|jgi:hypothetical protein